MTLDQLVTLQTVSNAKSFRRAAELLHITQPAVSKQIASLEAELGERLFERGRTASPTAAGKMLLRHAEHLSDILRTARYELADLKELKRGNLSIGASHTIATETLPRLVEKYRRAYPQVILSIKADWSPQILSQVTSRDVDLGVVVLIAPRLDNMPHLACIPLADAEVVFVAAPKDPAARKRRLTFEEFLEVPLILTRDGCLYRQYLESRFAEKGCGMNIAVEAIGIELQKRLTQLGLGASLLSRSLIARELKEKSLATFTVQGLKLRSYSCLVYRRDKYIHGAMRGFLSLLEETFEPAKDSLRKLALQS